VLHCVSRRLRSVRRVANTPDGVRAARRRTAEQAANRQSLRRFDDGRRP
jgi:hypothetical protein